MNILKRKERDLKLAKYLCTVVGTKPDNKPIYHTMEEAAKEFDLCPSHIAKIKRVLIGLDVDGKRSIKEEYLK